MKNIIKKITLFAIIALTVLGSKNRIETKQTGNPSKITINVTGNYVSSDYENRNQRYDWVAVSVKQNIDSTVHISVRSRADIKKPTCTFDTNATKINDITYKAEIYNKNIIFTFNNNNLNITTENKEDIDILSYYCSGGGSLKGDYKKIEGSLDKEQIDPTIFNKTLSLQNIMFFVSTIKESSIKKLIIQPYGLEIDNSKIIIEIDGSVTNAEIEDMNSDGYPEILIYTVSTGSGSYGNVIGYSVNNGKSISGISFPNIADNPKANVGYMGHDEFAIAENTLVHRFHTYNSDDNNATPTGYIRQIQYKLKEGEACRQFVIDKILEYPAK